jgi:hypothetical protein
VVQVSDAHGLYGHYLMCGIRPDVRPYRRIFPGSEAGGYGLESRFSGSNSAARQPGECLTA